MENLLDIYCANCNKQFQKKDVKIRFTSKMKGRNDNPTIWEALSKVFSEKVKGIDVVNKYLCTDCSNKLAAVALHLNVFNEKRKEESYLFNFLNATPSAPEPEPLEHSTPTRPKKRKRVLVTPAGKKFRKFMNNKKAKIIMHNQIRNVVRQEMNKLVEKTCLRIKIKDHNDVIPDDTVLKKEFEAYCPLLYSILNAAMTRSQDSTGVEFIPQMRSLLGIMLNTRNRCANVFQKSVGLELFFGRCSMRTFGILNKLGISCSYNTVTATLDRVVEGFDKQLLKFKKDWSTQLQAAQLNEWIDVPHDSNIDDSNYEMGPLVDLDDAMEMIDDATPGCSRRLNFEDIEDVQDRGMYLGGIFTVDNINHLPQTLHYGSHSKPTMINMTSVAFIYNRVHQPIENVIKPQEIKNAVDVELDAYIPSISDMELLKEDHQTLLKRILVKHLPYFKDIANDQSIVWYKPHMYTEESKKKTKTINLGMIDSDGATTEGTKQIMAFVKKYFPVLRDDKLLPTVVGGDALTCDLLRSTMFHMCNSDKEEEKLKGPNPAVGQFHLRMCLLGGIIKQFMGDKNKTKPGVGTLPHLRGVFGHPEKMDDVKKNFHLATRFMDFCLASYVCAHAMKVMNMSILDFEKECKDDPKHMKLTNLEKVVKETLDFEWLDVARNTSQERFCVCQEKYDKDDKRTFIACDNNRCKFEFWYHVDCLKDKNNQTYRKPPLRLSTKYFCTAQCENEASDKKVLYSQGFMHAWLNFSGYRDAIRSNDSQRMNCYNKLHLINFSTNNNYKYFRVVHLWQAQKAGWAAPNIVFDLLHNSTVNLCGKSNSNFELDLFHEFLNRYLKSLILVQFGLMTKSRLVKRSRTHQILKEVRTNWESLLREVDEDENEHNARYEKWKDDIKAAADMLINNQLLSNCGKREHSGFSNFLYRNCFVENISLYREKLQTFARRLDHVQEYNNEVRHSVVHNVDIDKGDQQN